MQEIPLSEYLKQKSQSELAAEVGCHQTLISRLFRTKRNITVVKKDNGKTLLRENFSADEKRRIVRQQFIND